MMCIDYYMNDGANWQAQAVLAYLRSAGVNAVGETWNSENKEYDANIEVGRYENCREQGYIFSVRYNGKQRNYAVYEHRNSDDLCVVVFDYKSINTPNNDVVADAMGNCKYNYTKSFKCGDIVACGDYITDDIYNFIDNNK